MPGKPRSVPFQYGGGEYTVEWCGWDAGPSSSSWQAFGIYDKNGQEVTWFDVTGDPREIDDDWLAEIARDNVAEEN
jgi:hypothetical protein